MTKGVRFLILDCPTDSTLPFYLAELKRHNVTDVVRCCEPTYRAETLQAENIAVHDWSFRDGAVPPSNIIKNWLQLVDSRIVRRPSQRVQRSTSPSNSASDEEDDIQAPTIAVHCVAGLGRAPILVAIALIELGMANLDTVEFIRKRPEDVSTATRSSILMDTSVARYSSMLSALDHRLLRPHPPQLEGEGEEEE